MQEQDRELLCQLRIVNQNLAQSVIELLRTMENTHLCPDALRKLADNLDTVTRALRGRADELANTVDVELPLAPVVQLRNPDPIVASTPVDRHPFLPGWADR